MNMPITLTPNQVRKRRMAAQWLYETRDKSSLTDVVRSVCGINAQRVSAMMLSLRARIRDLERSDIEDAISKQRTLVRTWAMRNTIHLLHAGDIRWFVALFRPGLMASSQYRRDQLGLGEEFLERAMKEIRAILKGGKAMTRWEIMDGLDEKGITLDRKSQAPIHLIHYAALKGMVCMGPDRNNGEPTYVLLDKWIGKRAGGAKKPDLAWLLQRYLAGYGPADMHDFAAWSRIPVTKAREAWRSAVSTGSITEGQLGEKSLWLLKEKSGSKTEPSPPKHVVKLLPAFDSYVLGYANRELVVPLEHHKDVYRGGLTVATVMVDGSAAGVWRHDRLGKRLEISVSPFSSFDKKTWDMISEEASDIGRFMGLAVSLDIKSPSATATPLKSV
jgi:hypothetical protein